MSGQDPRGQPASATVHIRVYFADTDLMGVVYHGVYLTWFEIGRTEYLRERGLPYSEVELRGISLPVTEASLTVRGPARYDDWIRIETTVDRVRSREVAFRYRVCRGETLLVEGRTLHIPVCKAESRGVRLPDWLRDRLQ